MARGPAVGEPGGLDDLGRRLKLADPLEAIGRPDVKAALHESMDAAARLGIFGVLTLHFAGEYFWGEDGTAMARRTWEQGAGWLKVCEWGRSATVSIGVQRKV